MDPLTCVGQWSKSMCGESGDHNSRHCCNLHTHQAHLPALVSTSFPLNKQDKTLALFEFSFGGVNLILENLVLCFISSTLVRLATMNLQTFMSARFQSIHKVKLWVLRLVGQWSKSILENQVTTTPDTCAICTLTKHTCQPWCPPLST